MHVCNVETVITFVNHLYHLKIISEIGVMPGKL